MGVLLGFGAVDVRTNGTTDHCARATMNDARAETAETNGPLSPANVQVPDLYHLRTWKC